MSPKPIEPSELGGSSPRRGGSLEAADASAADQSAPPVWIAFRPRSRARSLPIHPILIRPVRITGRAKGKVVIKVK